MQIQICVFLQDGEADPICGQSRLFCDGLRVHLHDLRRLLYCGRGRNQMIIFLVNVRNEKVKNQLIGVGDHQGQVGLLLRCSILVLVS